jgi:hypothetical protein
MKNKCWKEKSTIMNFRFVSPRRGIVPWEDVEILRAIEDKVDGQAAKEALKEPGMLSLEDVKREMGL